jgi:hypothetical protein
MSHFTLTDLQFRAWNSVRDKFPGYAKRYQLIAEYARDQGGLVLAYWRLHRGPLFGERAFNSTPDCARELGVAVSTLRKIEDDTWAWVQPRLLADPDYQALKRLSRAEKEAILRGEHR